jgi:hypothetical protein
MRVPVVLLGGLLVLVVSCGDDERVTEEAAAPTKVDKEQQEVRDELQRLREGFAETVSELERLGAWEGEIRTFSDAELREGALRIQLGRLEKAVAGVESLTERKALRRKIREVREELLALIQERARAISATGSHD